MNFFWKKKYFYKITKLIASLIIYSGTMISTPYFYLSNEQMVFLPEKECPITEILRGRYEGSSGLGFGGCMG